MKGLSLKCPSGIIGSAVDFGVTTVFEDQRTCSHKGSTQYCTKFLHTINFEENFKSNCIGKDKCSIE